MIRTTIEIQCNNCGRHQSRNEMTFYRISGLVSGMIKDAELAGWVFDRGAEHKLLSVWCPMCAKKNGAMLY